MNQPVIYNEAAAAAISQPAYNQEEVKKTDISIAFSGIDGLNKPANFSVKTPTNRLHSQPVMPMPGAGGNNNIAMMNPQMTPGVQGSGMMGSNQAGMMGGYQGNLMGNQGSSMGMPSGYAGNASQMGSNMMAGPRQMVNQGFAGQTQQMGMTNQTSNMGQHNMATSGAMMGQHNMGTSGAMMGQHDMGTSGAMMGQQMGNPMMQGNVQSNLGQQQPMGGANFGAMGGGMMNGQSAGMMGGQPMGGWHGS